MQYRYQTYREEQLNMKPIHFSRIKRDVPSSYDRDEMMLLMQGPTVIYAYWELSQELRKAAEHQCRISWETIHKQLRVYDCTMLDFNGHNAHRYVDISLPEMTNNWFIHELDANRTYIVDLGVWTKQGTFLTLLRSNAIDTPRTNSSDKDRYTQAVHQWKEGKTTEPEWLEHYSTYTYYETVK